MRVCSHFPLGRIAKLYSIATLAGFSPNCSNSCHTVVPASNSRFSPLTCTEIGSRISILTPPAREASPAKNTAMECTRLPVPRESPTPHPRRQVWASQRRLWRVLCCPSYYRAPPGQHCPQFPQTPQHPRQATLHLPGPSLLASPVCLPATIGHLKVPTPDFAARQLEPVPSGGLWRLAPLMAVSPTAGLRCGSLRAPRDAAHRRAASTPAASLRSVEANPNNCWSADAAPGPDSRPSCQSRHEQRRGLRSERETCALRISHCCCGRKPFASPVVAICFPAPSFPRDTQKKLRGIFDRVAPHSLL